MVKNISKKKLRDFGLIIGFFPTIMIGWIIPAVSGNSFRPSLFFFAIPFVFLAFFKPRLLFYPYIFWMYIGNILGKFNSFLILGFIFFMVLQPLAIIMKIRSYDPLRIKKKNQNSYKEFKKNFKINLRSIF